MQQNSSLNLPKWPFYLGNILLVGIAILLAFQAGSQLTTAQFFWSFLCVATGAIIFATPFILEYQGQIRIAEAQSKTIGTQQLKQIDGVLNQMQEVQESFTQQTNKQTMSHAMLDAVLKNLDSRLNSFAESVGSFDTLAQNISALGEITQSAESTGLAPAAQTLLEQMAHQIQSIQKQLQSQSSNATHSEDTTRELRSLKSQTENIGNVLTNLQQTIAGQTATLNTLQTAQASSNKIQSSSSTESPKTFPKEASSKALGQRNAIHASDFDESESTQLSQPSISELLTETHDIVNEAEALFNSITGHDLSSQETSPELDAFEAHDLTNLLAGSSPTPLTPPQSPSTASLAAHQQLQNPNTQASANTTSFNGPTNIDELVERNIYAPEDIHISLHGDDVSPSTSYAAPTSTQYASQGTHAINTASFETSTEAATQQTLFTPQAAANATTSASATQEQQTQTAQTPQKDTSTSTETHTSGHSYMESLLMDDSSAALQENDTHTFAQGMGTTLTVHALPGLGKKPFIRGQGPGLSWNHGTPMEFLETGKWQWTSPDSSQPVILRIYKDDEIPAEGEAIALEPGEQLEITPNFKA